MVHLSACRTSPLQAVKVYESATTDVIGEKSARLWVEYGRFCR